MREIIQLDIIKEILTKYSEDNIPVHFFLKDFYKKHRQFGARDRRFYSDIVYKYFRCKTLFPKLPFEEKLCYSGFLTTAGPNDFYKYLYKIQSLTLPLFESWNNSTEEKLNLLLEAGKISWLNYFPAAHSIDDRIIKEPFLKSHLTQPRFYIRVQKNHIKEAIQKLEELEIVFEYTEGCFAFASQLDVSKLLPEDYFEVQDLSSQQTIDLFQFKGNETTWDCCAGAGGKSLMLMDKYPDIKLYCSDNRQSILENLNTRFNKHNIKPMGVNVYDIVKKRSGLIFNAVDIPENFFDIIIADVPCSGSGTWGRNPERLSQFKEEEVQVYCSIQRSLVENSFKYLKPGGKLIYITCSVYTEENSQNVQSFEKLGLKTLHENYFIGYDKNADTLYGAVMEKV
jgi:16S rRNA (cytosine967-C5)-methyltransferase